MEAAVSQHPLTHPASVGAKVKEMGASPSKVYQGRQELKQPKAHAAKVLQSHSSFSPRAGGVLE